MAKLNWNILPLPLLEPVVEVLQSQAKGRGDFGWIDRDVREHIAALLRHISELQNGNAVDSESGLMVTAHIAARAIMILGCDLQLQGVINQYVVEEQGVTDGQK